MPTQKYEIAIIGGGIVGLATAKALVDRSVRSLIVLEAEDRVATHQTGHNSGVIHAGLYYKPGSLKARNCVTGREMMYRFCAEHGVAHENCGKLVVAVDDNDMPALKELQRRGEANGLKDLRLLGPEELKEYEPHVHGVAGMHVRETGIADFQQAAEVMADLVETAGGQVHTQSKLIGVQQRPDGLTLETTSGEIGCQNLIACAGLYADRVAKLCGVKPGLRIVPFRGEYYHLLPNRSHLVKNLIYPVPDPQFPFLGVHFTRTVSGRIEAGPNAVLALAREGYRRRDISCRDLFSLATYSGFWRMAFKHAGMGIAEMYRSFSKTSFARALQRLVPEVQTQDIERAGAGVRAQALLPNGNLVDDFYIVEAERMLHVLNAPSPAATASLAIGVMIAEKAVKNFAVGHVRRT